MDQFENWIRSFTRAVAPSVKFRVVAADPDDNRILECAHASKSEYIVTGDKDLLRLREFEGIQIITLADFLELHLR